MEMWLPWVLGSGGLVGFIGVYLTYKASKRRNSDQAKRERDTSLSERFQDATAMSQYIRDEIATEVERQVAPIRAQMDALKEEQHELTNAVRARETELWMWDVQGRQGGLPMLPVPILEKIGLRPYEV